MMRYRSLKNILFLLFCLAAIIPMLIAGGLSIHFFSSSLEKEITGRSISLSEQMADKVRLFLDTPVALIRQVATVVNHHAGKEPHLVQNYLEEMVKNFTQFERLMIIDESGRVMATAPFNPDYMGIDMSSQTFFKDRTADGNIQWSPTFVSHTTGQSTIAISLNLARFIVVGYVNLDNLSNFADVISDKSMGESFLYDQNGIIIAHSDRSLVRQRQHIQKVLSGIALSEQDAAPSFYMNTDGDTIIHRRLISGTSWQLALTQSRKNVFAPVYKTRQYLAVSMVLMIGLAVTLAFFSLKAGLNPLYRFTEAVKNVAAGNYHMTLEKETYEELDNLRLAMGEMIDAIKEREQELQKNEQHFRRYFELGLIGMVDIDVNGRLLRVNDHFCHITGYTRQQLMELSWTDITEKEDAKEENRLFNDVVEGQSETYSMEKQFRHQTGEIRYATVAVRGVHQDDGKIMYLVALFEDITPRKEAEKALVDHQLSLEETISRRTRSLKETADALMRSNQDLQQFAYVASHDLQEPLRMVASYTQLLADRYQDKLDEKANKYIYYAVDGASRLQTLIQDLLSFSRVNTHGSDFEKVDLNELVQTVLDQLKLKISETSARIDIEPLPVVKADQSQIYSVFLNLVMNALKFCKDKSPEIKIASEKKDGYWQISVSDNGIGIESKYKEKIFVIFQRLHTKSEYPGTGIGLALCKRIMLRHGGEMWFESTPGKGSTFYFSIPALD